MNSPPKPKSAKPPEPDTSIIASAPIEPEEVSGEVEAAEEERYQEIINDLQIRVGDLEAENASLKAKKTIDDVKAALLKPYTNRVFVFVVLYCVVVGGMLLMAGWKANTGFELSDTILSIIAGSTAVSVIGLIGMVISGLFGGKSQ